MKTILKPDWTLLDEPYLNEKKCEYQVRVSINFFGDMYHDGQDFSPADPRSRIFYEYYGVSIQPQHPIEDIYKTGHSKDVAFL